MESTVILSIFTMLGLGVIFAILLSIAYRYFKVEENPKVGRVEELLPGLNCGACGFGSCHADAEHLVKEKDLSVSCKILNRNELERISDIVGVSFKKQVSLKAIVHCGGTDGNVKHIAEYRGVESCSAAQLVKGGFLSCKYGCLGLGDCAEVCSVNAIEIVDGLAKVDIDKCIGCGKCMEICPRDIISLEELNNNKLIKIACNSTDSGKEVRQVCKVGCIACRLCEKKRSDGVFEVKNNLSRINYKKAKQFDKWQEVINSCPTDCIKLEIVSEKNQLQK